jgi:hypothetical protein
MEGAMARSACDDGNGNSILTYGLIGVLLLMAAGFFVPDFGDALWGFFRKILSRF